MNNPAEAPLYPYPPDYTNSETALEVRSLPEDWPCGSAEEQIYSSRKRGYVASIDINPQAASASHHNLFLTDSPVRALLLGLLLAMAIFAIYWPVHSHSFSDLDDPRYVTQNPHIQNGLTLSTVLWAFTHGYAANWHPVTWVSHALDIDMFGLDPAGPHDENVLFHALDAVLLFWVLRRPRDTTGAASWWRRCLRSIPSTSNR